MIHILIDASCQNNIMIHLLTKKEFKKNPWQVHTHARNMHYFQHYIKNQKKYKYSAPKLLAIDFEREKKS